MKVCKTAKFYKFEGWEKTPSKFFLCLWKFFVSWKKNGEDF